MYESYRFGGGTAMFEIQYLKPEVRPHYSSAGFCGFCGAILSRYRKTGKPVEIMLPKSSSNRSPDNRISFGYDTVRLSVTLKTFGTKRAAISAICLSRVLSTTPSSVTLPFFTIIRIGAFALIAYFSKPDLQNMAR
jgi:hypothetical protein